jgi:UDP-N-acetylmuramoylalanine--D-glutamate ligase
MLELENRQILLLGLGSPGEATCEFLRLSGARVVGVDDHLHLRALNPSVAAKTVTSSADDRSADSDFDGGLLVSCLPNCSGPWQDMEDCQLRGPHNAENLMAALTVGHGFRLPLEDIEDSLKTYQAGWKCFDLVAEINGVEFFDDSKATNLDSFYKSARATRSSQGGALNFWQVAGGKAKGLDFRDLGAAFSKFVKRALLVGEPSERIGVAWNPFPPCTVARWLLEAVSEAAKNATSGDLVLLVPARSGWVQFRNHQHPGRLLPGSEINR